MTRAALTRAVATTTAALTLAAGIALATPTQPAAGTTPVAAATIIPRKTIPPSPTPAPTAAPILLVAVGDSLTYGLDGSTYASYRQELTTLLNRARIPHTWNVQAVGGTKCSYWATRIATLIDTWHPALILLDCGTNDTPTDNTQADYTTILAAAAARNTRIIASLIGRPDPDGAANITRWPTIDNWMDQTNTAIRAALASYPAVPVANTLRLPNNAEWLTPDGIHWTTRAEAAVAQLFYAAAAPVMGWPSLAALGVHEMCGLSGHDRDDRWPALASYNVCRSE